MSVDSLVFNDPSRGHEIARYSGQYYNPQNSACIARVRDGECLAGVVFTNYVQGVSICAHTAVFAEHGVNRDLLFASMDFPFNQLGVKRIFGFVPECNVKAQAFNMKLGFQVVARIEGMFRFDDACLVMRLDRENARLLGIKARHIQSNKAYVLN